MGMSKRDLIQTYKENADRGVHKQDDNDLWCRKKDDLFTALQTIQAQREQLEPYDLVLEEPGELSIGLHQRFLYRKQVFMVASRRLLVENGGL